MMQMQEAFLGQKGQVAWSGERSILPALQPICEEYSNVFMEWWNNLEWNILGAAAEEANIFRCRLLW